MSDLAFEGMLAEHNQAFKDAAEFSDWMPDDGEYTVSVVRLDKDVSIKDNVTLGWWKLTARIEAGENADKVIGQEFSLGFYSTKNMGIMKGQCRALNGGEGVDSLAEADAVFEAAKGKILRVKVNTSTSKKNGKEYTNCYVQEVIATEDVPDVAQEEPPQVEEVELTAQAEATAPVDLLNGNDVPF